MEIKNFKKQSEFDAFVNDLKSDVFYKVISNEKGLFRTSTKALIFSEKDIEEYVINKFHYLLEILGIKDFQEKVYLNTNKFYIKLNCEEQNSFLLKKYGHIISSIQNLIVSYVFAKFNKWYQVLINVNNHLHNQKYFFKKQIYFALKNINQTNKVFHFKPMPNDQRRMIHEIVKTMDGVSSYSEGNGYSRHIVIKKENDKIA